MNATFFQQQLLDWFDKKGRKDLPWQRPATPYQVWVSEIMLQQTQVVTVIPYFLRFMQAFPDIKTLANAPLDNVLTLWAGLGYYARARNLHKSAQQINQQGYFPETVEELVKLSGIGLSTAGAISSIAFNRPAAILDGNVRRVLARIHAIEGWVGERKISEKLWDLSHFYTPIERIADYTQAIMDLGATLCTRSKPQCSSCPFNEDCLARIEAKITQIPTPKPKKTKPIRKTIFLIVQSENQVMMKKRAEKGIWGGLWSFPEFEDLKILKKWCLDNEINFQSPKKIAVQRHTFSHYHLDYTAMIIYHNKPENIIMDKEQTRWYQAKQNNTLALPAPIARLLQEHIMEKNNEND